MCGCFPRQQADQTVLEYKDNTNSVCMSVLEDIKIPSEETGLALNRLKLLVINGRLKPGRLAYFEDPRSPV